MAAWCFCVKQNPAVIFFCEFYRTETGEKDYMALADVISQLGSTIINLVSNTVQGIADYLDDNIGDIPDTGGESVSMMEFVKNTPVDTLETTDKTIVGSINELNIVLGTVSTALDNINGEVV